MHLTSKRLPVTAQRTSVRGFTLLELMLVVAVISILSVIAIPAYNEYVARGQMSEAVELMSGTKSPLAEFFSDRGYWPAAIGSVASTLTGKYVSTISGASDPLVNQSTYIITATMRSSGVNSQVQGTTATLTTTDAGRNWICASGGAAAVPEKFLPAACR